MKYLISLILIFLGIMITLKSEWMLKTFGYSDWAETKFLSWGGSRAMYKFLGIIIVFLTLFYVTGFLQEIIVAIFVPGSR